MTEHVELRRGVYHDSVSLMQVSRAVAQTPGVDAAQVAMATDLNVELIAGMGFTLPADAGPNDLVVAVRARRQQIGPQGGHTPGTRWTPGMDHAGAAEAHGAAAYGSRCAHEPAFGTRDPPQWTIFRPE